MHPDDTDALAAPDADQSREPASQAGSDDADMQRSRRAFLRAALVGTAAITGGGAAAIAPWRPQIFGLSRIAYAAVSPAPTAVPHATATPTSSPTATSPTATPTASPTATTTPPSAGITIENLAFSPAALTVSQGATVTWTNDDGFPHTSTSDTSGLWDSGAIAGNGGAFSFTFNLAPGVYSYHCSIHTFMKGSVTVT